MLYSFWERYRVILLVAGGLAFVALSFWFYSPGSDGFPAHPMETPVYASEQSNESALSPRSVNDKVAPRTNDETKQPMYVDVKGSVKNPGVYPLLPNERIQNVVAKAGGFLPEADLQRVNLAQPLTDGMAVIIPAKGKTSPCSPASLISEKSEQASQFEAQPARSTGQDSLINLNTADVKELMKLPGVGELRAQTIISYRDKNGPFTSVDQLKKVSGIGEKTFEKLKSKIMIQ